MWWRRFLEEEDSTTLLPRETIERSIVMSNTQIEKMGVQKEDLKEEIVNLSKTLATKYSDNIESLELEKSIKKENSRKLELISNLAILDHENNELDRDIALNDMMLLYSAPPKYKNQVTSLIYELAKHALAANDEEIVEKCVMAIELLSRESAFTASNIRYWNSYYSTHIGLLKEKLDGIIRKIYRTVHKLVLFRTEVEMLQSLRPDIASIDSEQIQKIKEEIKELDKSRDLLIHQQQRIDELTSVRIKLQSECSDLQTAKVTEVDSEYGVSEGIELKKRISELSFQILQANERKDLANSQISQYSEDIELLDNQISAIRAQHRLISQRPVQITSRPDVADTLGLDSESTSYLYEVYKKSSLREYINTLETHQRTYQSQKKHLSVTKHNIIYLQKQNKELSARIASLEELIETGRRYEQIQ